MAEGAETLCSYAGLGRSDDVLLTEKDHKRHKESKLEDDALNISPVQNNHT